MSVATSLAGAIQEKTATWDDLLIERSIFGTVEPDGIAELVLEFVSHHLGTAVTSCGPGQALRR
jgi:hypothetical protein